MQEVKYWNTCEQDQIPRYLRNVGLSPVRSDVLGFFISIEKMAIATIVHFKTSKDKSSVMWFLENLFKNNEYRKIGCPNDCHSGVYGCICETILASIYEFAQEAETGHRRYDFKSVLWGMTCDENETSEIRVHPIWHLFMTTIPKPNMYGELGVLPELQPGLLRDKSPETKLVSQIILHETQNENVGCYERADADDELELEIDACGSALSKIVWLDYCWRMDRDPRSKARTLEQLRKLSSEYFACLENYVV